MLKKVPHTYVIIFSIIVFAAILTWFIPGGEYDRETIVVNGVKRTVIVDNSFHQVESSPQTWQVFAALFKGFERQAGIVIFVLMIGGAFWILNDSKAIDVGIFAFLRLIKRLEKKKFFRFFGVDNIVLTLIMILFSVFGSVFGMSEETIPFIIILVPLAISMGYDSITGVCLIFVAAAFGLAGATLNPFSIGIAQGLSDIPLYSGIEFRFVCYLIITIFGIIYVLRYARKIKKYPEKSIMYKEDEYWRKRGLSGADKIAYQTPLAAWITFLFLLVAFIIYSCYHPATSMMIGNSTYNIKFLLPVLTFLYAIFGILSLRKSVHFFILELLIFTIVFLIVGVMGYEWGIMEIATLFLGLGIVSGMAMSNSASKIAKLFVEGAKDIMTAAIIVGLAGGIIIILEDGKVIDTIMYGLSKGMKGMGKIATVEIMYVIQTLTNVLIPSSSAKAALSMPILAPFSDLIGISRQATVMAYQFGDAFTNIITPTSGVMMAVIGVAKIPYEKWVKWLTPFIILLMLLGAILLIPTVTMNLNGF